jgi:hypothetical protein
MESATPWASVAGSHYAFRVGAIETALDFIDTHAGAMLFLATLALAFATWRLARESALSRLTAVVTLTATIWEGNEDVAVFRLANHGSAAARRVRLLFTWMEADGKPVGGVPVRNLELPVLGPGDQRIYAPDTLIAEVDGHGFLSIDSLARDRLIVLAEWSWIDGRHRIFGLGEPRHRDRLKVEFESFKNSVHGAPNMIEPREGERAGGTVVPGVAGRVARERELPRIG